MRTLLCTFRLLPLAFALLVMACAGPRITIRHEDPTHRVIDVVIDNEAVGTLEYGEWMMVLMERGLHVVDVTPVGAEANPWTDDGGAWRIYIEGEVNLTLIQDLAAPEPVLP